MPFSGLKCTTCGLNIPERFQTQHAGILKLCCIETMQQHHYQELNEVCVICHDELTNDQPLQITTCGHFFHHSCLSSWFRNDERNHSCPICRERHCDLTPLRHLRQRQLQQAQYNKKFSIAVMLTVLVVGSIGLLLTMDVVDFTITSETKQEPSSSNPLLLSQAPQPEYQCFSKEFCILALPGHILGLKTLDEVGITADICYVPKTKASTCLRYDRMTFYNKAIRASDPDDKRLLWLYYQQALMIEYCLLDMDRRENDNPEYNQVDALRHCYQLIRKTGRFNELKSSFVD